MTLAIRRLWATAGVCRYRTRVSLRIKAAQDRLQTGLVRPTRQRHADTGWTPAELWSVSAFRRMAERLAVDGRATRRTGRLRYLALRRSRVVHPFVSHGGVRQQCRSGRRMAATGHRDRTIARRPKMIERHASRDANKVLAGYQKPLDAAKIGPLTVRSIAYTEQQPQPVDRRRSVAVSTRRSRATAAVDKRAERIEWEREILTGLGVDGVHLERIRRVGGLCHARSVAAKRRESRWAEDRARAGVATGKRAATTRLQTTGSIMAVPIDDWRGGSKDGQSTRQLFTMRSGSRDTDRAAQHWLR